MKTSRRKSECCHYTIIKLSTFCPQLSNVRFSSLVRVLKVFLSRTAQRVPYMSSLHLLRILGVMLMTVSWFLCAWTVGVLQNRDRNIPVFVTTNTSDGQGFNLCYLDRWDYMMAVGECQQTNSVWASSEQKDPLAPATSVVFNRYVTLLCLIYWKVRKQ